MSTNNSIGYLIDFYSFIPKHDIVIPRIQRDYTYGSLTEKTEEVLNKMLSGIWDALTSPNQVYILDFVYGSRNKSSNAFEPLDGQQRLTTLFLLYLYAGWTSGQDLSLFHFNYSTRDNTADFCRALISNKLFSFNKWCWCCEAKCRYFKISDQIRDCAFFRPSFNDDPSIKSMLNVLDRIDEKFKDLAMGGTLWSSLTQNCPIKFYCLDFGKFGLSDDLYIKMNSRGKALTEYEIFKSQLEKFIEVDLHEKDLKYDFARKFDTDFTDLVWHEQHMNLSKIDDSFVFIFRNLLAIRNYLHGLKQSLVDLKSLGDYIPQNNTNNKKKPTWYIGEEDVRFFIDFLDVFHQLYKLAESQSSNDTANDIIWNLIFYSSKDVRGETVATDTWERIRVFNADVNLFRTACNKRLGTAEIVMLYAMYRSCKLHPLRSLDADAVSTWKDDLNTLRHIRNLVENSDDELSHADNIGSILKDVETILQGDIGAISNSKFNKNQMVEEKAKSVYPDRWKKLYPFENHDIFRGALSLMAPPLGNDIFALGDNSVFNTLTARLEKVYAFFDNDSKKSDNDKAIRANFLSWADFGQIYRSDQTRHRNNRMLGFLPGSWRLLLTRNGFFDQSKILELLDIIRIGSAPNLNIPISEWRYYATNRSYYPDTYVSYPYAKYGYYFIPDPSRPLEIFLLQSTSCAEVDNVMWKLMNRLLWAQLRKANLVDPAVIRIGSRQLTPEITIDEKFTIDCVQNGWKVFCKADQQTLVSELKQKGYTVTDENVVSFGPEQDYIQFGIALVKDIILICK